MPRRAVLGEHTVPKSGYKLANQGVDTRSLQQYLGHRNIQNTVVYTQLNANRFNGWWN
jgi:site-specific recombinase XerD